MKKDSAHDSLGTVVELIQEIDRDCRTKIGGSERGLVNIKLHFIERALKATSKKLTEEQLIAWLLAKKLAARDLIVHWELPYPTGERKKCDLVIQINNSCRIWLELKLAWKAWMGWEGVPVHRNSLYLSYLQGKNRSHSFRHDFEKIGHSDWPKGDFRAICLVGFDHRARPMDAEVVSVVNDVQGTGIPWEIGAVRHWSDRRSGDFRINVWSWLLPPV